MCLILVQHISTEMSEIISEVRPHQLHCIDWLSNRQANEAGDENARAERLMLDHSQNNEDKLAIRTGNLSITCVCLLL